MLVYVCAFWFSLFCGASYQTQAYTGEALSTGLHSQQQYFHVNYGKKMVFTRTLLKILSNVLNTDSMENHEVS